jgi:thioesterase domain-containing protein
MARQLRRGGEEVQLVALFDTPAPLGNEETDLDLAVVSTGLAREQARQHGRSLDLTADELQGLPAEEQLRRVLAAMRDAQLVGSEVDVPLLQRFVDGFIDRSLAVSRYAPESYAGRIDLFRPADVDAEIVQHMSPERRRQLADPERGWGALATSGVRAHQVSGYHETMLLDPHARGVAEVLRDVLAEVETVVVTTDEVDL